MPGSQIKPDPGMEQLISAEAFEASAELVQAMGKEAGRRACGEHQKKKREEKEALNVLSATTANVNSRTNFICLRGNIPQQSCPGNHGHRIS